LKVSGPRATAQMKPQMTGPTPNASTPESSYAQGVRDKITSLFELISKPLCGKDNIRCLDFGCHDGALVSALREEGIDAYGFDIADGKQGVNIKCKHARWGTLSDYRIPFPDDYFDVAFSHHVFEHVQNYDISLKELSRVLKPTGIMLHVFPSRWRLLESHFHVPFGGVFHPRWWCFLSRAAGLSKPGKGGLPWLDYAATACRTIQTDTNYLSRSSIFVSFGAHFDVVHSLAGRYAAARLRWGLNPPLERILDWLVSEFHVRILVCARKVPRGH
jgi:SAM-dependent methyltransferase